MIPDLGCGAYNNDPEEVGRLLGEALQKYRGQFLQVHLVGPATGPKIQENSALVVWNMFVSIHNGNFIIRIDEPIFFRGVA